LISWIFTTLATICFGQSSMMGAEYNPEPRGDNGIRIMFYNVENLFDTFDDPAINDDEFTPDGNKSWSYYRYKEKLNNIAKTIIAVGGWEAPSLIGLCEIENFQVLMDLTTETPLKKYGYQIIHENSGDLRGIDVAILYRPEKLVKIDHESIHIEDPTLVTRDILYASFSYKEKDTLHFFVNHWPSRIGGKEFSEKKRVKVASVLKSKIDSLRLTIELPKIFIMGDFNDEPSDQSLMVTLNAILATSTIDGKQLYNLTFQDFHSGRGTLVYKEIDHTWFLFDQMIVSGAVINGKGLLTKGKKNVIFKSEWLLKNDRPFRTYQGPIYRGGFSDHLPIFIDMYYKN
jgi:hypothetical protein